MISEAQLHEQVADYLRLQYPDVLFHTDFGSGVKLTMGQAVKQKRLNGGRRAWPDLFIAEREKERWQLEWDENIANHTNVLVSGNHYGFFLELKKEGTRLKKKNGELVANEHVREQAAVLDELRNRGYKAEFAVGFDEAKKIIDEYLGEKR